MGVFKSGNKLWIRYRDVDGTWHSEATEHRVGQEKLAQAVYDELVSRIRSATTTGEKAAGPLTVRGWAALWLAEPKRLDLDWHSDEGRLRNHVLPVIGEMQIAAVRTRHILELFHRIRTNTEQPIAPRTVHSIYGTLSAFFRDAKLADTIEQTPCCLDVRHLGPLVDKDPEWRATAVCSREEAETLISHPEIPFDRRMVYALELLAGLRTGEAAALRCAGATTTRTTSRSGSSSSRSRTTRGRRARSGRRRTRSSTSRCTRRWPRCWPSGSSAAGPR